MVYFSYMDTRSQFLLLVAAYLQAQSAYHHSMYAWNNVKRARLIPDEFWMRGVPVGLSVEQMAYEFVTWTDTGKDASRPAWLPHGRGLTIVDESSQDWPAKRT